MGAFDGQGYEKLVNFQEFLLLIDFKFLLRFEEFVIDGLDFVRDLVSLFFKIGFSFLIFFYLFVILTNLPDSFKILMIVLNDVDIGLLVVVLLELVLVIALLFA